MVTGSLAGSFENKRFYKGYVWSNIGFSSKIFNEIKSKKRLIFSMLLKPAIRAYTAMSSTVLSVFFTNGSSAVSDFCFVNGRRQ